MYGTMALLGGIFVRGLSYYDTYCSNRSEPGPFY
jgi:hypothetical protein